jgi:ABC-type long-subunit fatty acid transport system fused permease/ATPase subunit
MIELYFLIFRIPRMMTQLARERDRSALVWSLIAIGAWIGSELFVGLIYGVIENIGIEFWGWSENPGLLSLGTYVCALGAAIASLYIVTRVLRNKPREQVLPTPPLPPNFHSSEMQKLD